MLTGVFALSQEGLKLGIVGIELFEMLYEFQRFGRMSETAYDEGKIQAGRRLAGIGLHQTVKQLDGLGEPP